MDSLWSEFNDYAAKVISEVNQFEILNLDEMQSREEIENLVEEEGEEVVNSSYDTNIHYTSGMNESLDGNLNAYNLSHDNHHTAHPTSGMKLVVAAVDSHDTTSYSAEDSFIVDPDAVVKPKTKRKKNKKIKQQSLDFFGLSTEALDGPTNAAVPGISLIYDDSQSVPNEDAIINDLDNPLNTSFTSVFSDTSNATSSFQQLFGLSSSLHNTLESKEGDPTVGIHDSHLDRQHTRPASVFSFFDDLEEIEVAPTEGAKLSSVDIQRILNPKLNWNKKTFAEPKLHTGGDDEESQLPRGTPHEPVAPSSSQGRSSALTKLAHNSFRFARTLISSVARAKTLALSGIHTIQVS